MAYQKIRLVNCAQEKVSAAATHRVLDLIAMGFQTVDKTGNERRKKCINLYSS